jgi:S1-C subfamily serine protease
MRWFVALSLALTLAGASRGDDAGTSWEPAAAKLQAATATVRIWVSGDKGASDKDQPASVTVCSGVCVGAGKIVTAAFAASDSRIRLTLAGGAQTDGKLQLIDEYSGLALLKCETAGLTPIAPAEAAPAVGQELLSAAAWGLEKPLVARAIVGGVDRQHPGAKYPPLLMCDALTAETSSGAGLVNRAGGLVGLIVAAEQGAGRRGWTYAVPVSHVQRILRAAEEHKEGGVVILKRRRPVVGWNLDLADEEVVVVQRVLPGSPAEKAGIKKGDLVLMADGVAIRAPFQAFLPTLHKQPGDTMIFRVRREDGERDLTVVLGGGVEVESAPADFLAGVVQPKVQLTRDARGIVIGPRLGGSTPAAVLPPFPDETPPAEAAPTTAEKLALQTKALERYQAVIEIQQRQLQALQAEIEALKKSLKAEK